MESDEVHFRFVCQTELWKSVPLELIQALPVNSTSRMNASALLVAVDGRHRVICRSQVPDFGRWTAWPTHSFPFDKTDERVNEESTT